MTISGYPTGHTNGSAAVLERWRTCAAESCQAARPEPAREREARLDVRRREEAVKAELARHGCKLISRFGAYLGVTQRGYQVVDNHTGFLVAGDSLHGWNLQTIEHWAFPDLARWSADDLDAAGSA